MGFKIRNATKNTVVCEEASIADSFWKRAKGLMFRKDWQEFDGLLLDPCGSIHTMGMRMKIDVCFLDAEQRIVKSVGSLGAWRTASGGRHGHATLELPAGTLERTGTEAGDRLALEQDEQGQTPAGSDEG